MTFCIILANRTVSVICEWKYALRSSDHLIELTIFAIFKARFSNYNLATKVTWIGDLESIYTHMPLWLWEGGRSHNRKIHGHHKKIEKIKQTDFHCVACAKKNKTLHIIVSLLIDVRITPHVIDTLQLQCDWILDRSVKYVVRWLNCFRCCNWYVCIHRVCYLVQR